MRIGIDIDGCLADVAKFITDFGTKFCYENNINFNFKEDEYDEVKALGISNENVEKFWNQHLVYYATKYPAREFASEVIKKLNEHNEIYIITARNEDGLPEEAYGYMQKMVKTWLENQKIQYSKLIFTTGSKLPYCLENKIDLMIEDAPKNVIEISQKIPVLCFDNPYNKNVEGKNIIRVYSWYDVLSKFKITF